MMGARMVVCVGCVVALTFLSQEADAKLPSDYYKMLGVERDAGVKDIKRAFRRMALKYHPDKNDSPTAEEDFRTLVTAYEILVDEDKRREYNAHGHQEYNTNYKPQPPPDFDYEAFWKDFDATFKKHFEAHVKAAPGSAEHLRKHMELHRKAQMANEKIHKEAVAKMERLQQANNPNSRTSSTTNTDSSNKSGNKEGFNFDGMWEGLEADEFEEIKRTVAVEAVEAKTSGDVQFVKQSDGQYCRTVTTTTGGMTSTTKECRTEL